MRDETPPLVWPALLRLPSAEVKVVYLDFNHWIALSQASVGHPKGSSVVGALEACRAARTSGSALFVLSATHYAEMLKIKDPSQRRELADVMEELTDFNTLVSRVVVMELELAAVLEKFATEPGHLPMVDLIGRGARHAFGLHSGMQIMGPLGDETERVRERMGGTVFDALVAELNVNLERSLLRGPADSEEVASLSALGWQLEPVLQVAEARGAEERAQTARLDCGGPWRHSRLRDVVSAREFIIEFQNILPRALKGRNLALSDVIWDHQSARVFARTMPSTEVSIELKTAWHRNRSKGWTANDIYDIDAMSLAVPYCDIVVTDKACHHVLNAARLGERMHTAVLRNLRDLPSVLDGWKPYRPSQNCSDSLPM